MRIWDIPTTSLCDKHLLAEHNELHTIWSHWTRHQGGWRNHPEVKRWEGHLLALFLRHNFQVLEMIRRDFRHNSPLLPDANKEALGSGEWPESWDPISLQIEKLRRKGCACDLSSVETLC